MIRLARSVSVSSFDAEATVAVGRDRPEFLAVARLAADLGRPIGARDVLQELLGARPDVLGWRVIDRCVGLGLLERASTSREAVLSAAGRIALDHQQVLVPEEGIWRFFVVDDPLVPAALIHAQRLDPEPVQSERAAAKAARARDELRPRPVPVPELLHNCRGSEPHPSVRSGALIQLVELARQGARGPRGELRLQLTWMDAPSLRLYGELPSDEDGKAARSKPIDADLELPGVFDTWSYERLWKALVSHATQVPSAELDDWQETTGALVVPASFQSLPPAARHAFRRDVDVTASNLPGLGRFEPTQLKDVSVVPASRDDAQAWLSWLQWESINDYVTPAVLEQQGRAQLARFPHHRVRALRPTELLARARNERGSRSWFVLGPSDLGLWS